MSISYQAKDSDVLAMQLAWQEIVLPVSSPFLYASTIYTRIDILEPIAEAFVLAVDATSGNVISCTTSEETSVGTVVNPSTGIAAVVARGAISFTTSQISGFEYVIIKYRVQE